MGSLLGFRDVIKSDRVVIEGDCAHKTDVGY